MELAGLKNELRHLLVIAQQLEPYIRSISSLMERIQPQVGATQEELEEDDGHDDEAQAQVQRNHGVAPVSVSQVSTLKASDAYHHEESLSPNHNTEEERLMAILERIQVLKPEYKQRYFIYEYRKSQMIKH